MVIRNWLPFRFPPRNAGRCRCWPTAGYTFAMRKKLPAMICAVNEQAHGTHSVGLPLRGKSLRYLVGSVFTALTEKLWSASVIAFLAASSSNLPLVLNLASFLETSTWI